MKKLILIVFVSLLCSKIYAEGLSKSEVATVKKLHAGFERSAHALSKFCVLGQMEVANLSVELPDAPLGTVSDFILMLDGKEGFRRQSCHKEVIHEGELKTLDWYTRIRDKRKIRGGFEAAGVMPEVEMVHNLLPDFDPWEIAIASTLDLLEDRVVNGYFGRYCDVTKATRLSESMEGTVVEYRISELVKLEVFYSKKFGNMPIRCAWFASAKSVDPNADVNSFTILASENRTSWMKVDDVWLPTKAEVLLRNSQAGQPLRLLENWKFTFSWLRKEEIDFEGLKFTPSSELWDLLIDNDSRH